MLWRIAIEGVGAEIGVAIWLCILHFAARKRRCRAGCKTGASGVRDGCCWFGEG
jgi:hypothetical protein